MVCDYSKHDDVMYGLAVSPSFSAGIECHVCVL